MAKDKRHRGQPTRYDANVHIPWAASLAKMGGSTADIAEAFGVSERTLYRWQKAHPEFCQTLKANKSQADAVIAENLFAKATGKAKRSTVHKRTRQDATGKVVETITEKTEETLAPDTTALIFWLKNRQPELWRDRPAVDDTDTAVLKAAKELVSGVQSAIG